MFNDALRASRNDQTNRHLACTTVPSLLMAALLLVGCQNGGSSGTASPSVASAKHPTQELQGHLAWATNLQVQVRLDTPGTLSSLRTLPLDPNANVTLGGKRVAATELPAGVKVTLTRDMTTHRVIAIEAE